MKNEIMEEVWRVRDQLASEYDHDLHAIVMALREMEKNPLTQLVDGPKRRRTMPTDQPSRLISPKPGR